jgi:hypothetical protein
MLQQAAHPRVVHPLGRRRLAERLPELLVRDQGLEELPQVPVLERTSRTQDLLRERPAVLLRRREIVLLGDIFSPEGLEPLHLHLERPTVLVCLALDTDIRRAVKAPEQLVG